MNKTPVKYFVAILTSNIGLLSDVLKRLSKYFGEADHIGSWFDFNWTNFYEPEMGPNLKRCLVSFREPRPSQLLAKAKKWTAKVENKFRIGGKRRVNIDAGYIDHCKLVLSSGKFGGHKIALTDECFADMLMDYQKGKWVPFAWCFPDFRSGIYDDDLEEMRRLLKKG